MLKKTKFYYYLLGIFIALDGFILYGYPQRYFEFAFSAVVFIVFLSDPYFRKRVIRDKFFLIAIGGLTLLSFSQMIFGRYGGVYSLSTTFILIGALCLFYYSDLKNTINTNRNKIFDLIVYLTMIGSLLYQFIKRMLEDPAVVNNIYEIYYSLGRDKNVLGIIVFSFFAICFKRRAKLGMILSIAFACILDSRMLQVALVIFIIIYLFKDPIFRVWSKFFNKKYWLSFLLAFIFTVIFSTIFVGYCTSHGLGSYQQAWNDASNYMRMTSNLFALNKIIKDPYFIFGGSDDYIYLFLGISENVRYLGERIVQPHNDIINLLVRSGLIYSLLYWSILGKLLETIINRDNIYIFLSFFFMSLFIRPIFVGPQLLIVLYTLVQETDKKKHGIKFKIKR